MKILKRTAIPHEYDAQGKWLEKPCHGTLDIVLSKEHGVVQHCTECDAVYGLRFTSTRSEEQ